MAFSGPAHKAAKCRAIGYIDLKIGADTFGSEPTTIPNINELSLRRHNIPPDALLVVVIQQITQFLYKQNHKN